MPWCPKCKEEYREGFTVCADCGEELVDSLDEVCETEDDGDEAAVEYEEYDWDAEEAAEEEEEKEQERQIIVGRNNTYVKKADEYSDLKSTGICFIGISILGIIYLVLCQLDIIPISYNIVALVVLGAMFLIFIAIGISSLVKAKQVKGMIALEEEETEQLQAWLEEHVQVERLEQMKAEAETEEEAYFAITHQIKQEIFAEYPDLEESYVEMMIEEYYDSVFEE